MVVRDLLNRMADVYAGAKTYADRGRVRILRVYPSSRSEDRESFATFLDRERGFRFAGSSDKRVLLWTPTAERPELRLQPLLMKFLVRQCSGIVTANVPQLLFPQEFGRGLIEHLQEAEYQGSQTLGALRCHRILGRWRDQSRLTLWMDEDRYLLRRVVDRTEHLWGTEAAALRDAHLDRRDRALAAGIPKKLVEQEFGADQLLAVPHWPYVHPREDSRAITTVAYEPRLNIPIDPQVFRRRA